MRANWLGFSLGVFLFGFGCFPVEIVAQEQEEILLEVQGTLETGDMQFEDNLLLDVYPIEIKKNSPLYISVKSDDFDSYLILIDEASNIIAKNDNFDGENSRIVLDSIEPGYYEIGVTSFNKDQRRGNYILKVKYLSEEDLLNLEAKSFYDNADKFYSQGTRGSYLDAINSFQSALLLYQRSNNYEEQSRVLNNIGYIYYLLGQIEKAFEYYQQSLAIAEKIGSLSHKLLVLNNIGSVYDSLGQKNEALENYEQSLLIAIQLGDRFSEARTLNNIGLIYFNLGQNDKALEYYQKSLPIRQEVGDRSGEGITLSNIGGIYTRLGQNNQALEYHKQSLSIARETHNSLTESNALNNIGEIYDNLEQKNQALEHYQQSLLIKQKIGDRSGEGITLNNIGTIYNYLGIKTKALECYHQALSIAREINNRSSEGIILNNIGLLYSNSEEKNKALEYYRQSLTITKEIGDRSVEGTVLKNIGNIERDLGKKEEALEYYQKSLAIAKEVNNRSVEGIILNDIAVVYSDLGQKENAMKYYYQSLAIAKEVGNRSDEAHTLSNIGHINLDNGDYQATVKYLLNAVEIYDSINAKELSDDLKISYFQTYLDTYYFLQQVLLIEGRITDAMEIAERGRARALVDLLNKRFAGSAEFIPTEQPTIVELKAIAKNENSSLVTYTIVKRDNAHKIYIYIITPSGKTEFREVDLAVANLDLSEIVQSARNIVTQRPGDQKETNRSATGMETNQFTVGEYVKLKGEFPTDEPWQIIAIDQEKGIVTLDQNLREAPLENVSIDRIASKTNTPLQQLHQILIEPIADLLPRNPTEKVIFMPQGALFGVPFPALQDKEGTYLLEKHTILTSPSIQVLAQTAQQNQRIAQQDRTDHQPLIVGNPYPYPQGLASLENARQEAIDIANLLGTQPLLGQEATKAQVLAQMPKADILHFATHASFNDQNGIQSAIYLTAEPGAPDDGLFQTPGRITAEEIFNQFENNPLNASIAVLSACDTGQGEITGDGVIGLSRSLIAAGVPSVLVSLWSVNDASTKTLMTEFYRQWQTERVDKATALRNAMLKLKEQYPEPYYWGAFTLIGEAD